MGKKTSKNLAYGKPERLMDAEGEKTYPWLSLIFDSYITADQSIYDAMDTAIRKGHRLACANGCSSCCKTHVTIPVYPLELMGIYWYIMDRLDVEYNEIIQRQLMDFVPGNGCPFLVEKSCGIHPVRPLACRFFNVFSKPCSDGEDPYYTRRKDVWTPDEKHKDKAVSKMLPHYGIVLRAERREAMKSGYMIQFVKNMQDINWPKVVFHLKNKDYGPMAEKGFHP